MPPSRHLKTKDLTAQSKAAEIRAVHERLRELKASSAGEVQPHLNALVMLGRAYDELAETVAGMQGNERAMNRTKAAFHLDHAIPESERKVCIALIIKAALRINDAKKGGMNDENR